MTNVRNMLVGWALPSEGRMVGGAHPTFMSLVGGVDDGFLAAGDADEAFCGGDFVEELLELEDVGDGFAGDGGDHVALADVILDEGAAVADSDDEQAGGRLDLVGGAFLRVPVGGDGAEEHALPAEAAALAGDAGAGDHPAAESELGLDDLALAIKGDLGGMIDAGGADNADELVAVADDLAVDLHDDVVLLDAAGLGGGRVGFDAVHADADRIIDAGGAAVLIGDGAD